MNETNSVRAITLKELWDLFIQRLLVIALVAVIAAGSFFALDMATYKPQYSSTATMYILRQGGGEHTSSGEAANELSLALRLVYDCNYFLKSRTVLNTVIEDLGLSMTYSQLHSRISTANPTNTRILEITVRGDSPEQAKAIVDRICDIAPGKIADAMGFSQVNLYEYGTLPVRPSNSPNLLKYGMVGLAAAVVTYAVYLLMFLLDDRLRTDEDVERTLGLSILAEIPNVGGSGKNRYSYYGGKRYGYGKRYGKRAYSYGYRHQAEKSADSSKKERS